PRSLTCAPISFGSKYPRSTAPPRVTVIVCPAFNRHTPLKIVNGDGIYPHCKYSITASYVTSHSTHISANTAGNSLPTALPPTPPRTPRRSPPQARAHLPKILTRPIVTRHPPLLIRKRLIRPRIQVQNRQPPMRHPRLRMQRRRLPLMRKPNSLPIRPPMRH